VLILFFIPLKLESFRWHRIDTSLLVWLGWCGSSALINTPWPQGGLKFESIVLMFVLYLVVRASISRTSNFYRIAAALSIPAIIQSFIGILQYFELFPLTSGFFRGYESQVFGTVGGSNVLGAFLAVSIPIVYFLIVNSKGRDRIWWILSLILILIALVLTKSRGAWVAVIIGLIVMKWDLVASLIGRVWTSKLRVFITIPVSVLLLSALLFGLYNLNPDSASGRLFIWSVTWDMISDHLWTGVGYGNFGLNWLEYQGSYLANPDASFNHLAANLTSAHSQYLNILAETGVIGLSLFLGFIFSIYSGLIKRAKRSDPEQRQRILTIGAALTILFTHALIDDVLSSLIVRIQFIIILSLFVSGLQRGDH